MNAITSEHGRADRRTATEARDPLESFRAPPGAGTLVTWLFVAGLAVAFAWLLIGYMLTRSNTPVPGLTVPVWFWFSTFILLVSSVCLHWSYLSMKMGRSTVAGYALLLSTTLGWVFVLLQTPGLVKLVQMHRESAEATAGGGGSAAPYMLILVLVALHGLHTVAGLARMTALNRRTHQNSDHEYGIAHLKQMCLFWHFLAIAWVLMFGVILWT